MDRWRLDIVLEGPHVCLQPITIADARRLYAAGQDPEIWRWWPFNPAASRDAFDAWIVDCIGNAAAGRGQHYVIVEQATGRALGSTAYCSPRPDHLAIEIGSTWLIPTAWRSGANTTSKLLLLDHAFGSLGVERVEFATDADDGRSRASLAALSAQFEGIRRRDRLLPGGSWRSTAYYSVLADEWPSVRAGLSVRVSRQLQGLEAAA